MDFIEQKSVQKPDVSEEDVTKSLKKPIADLETYCQLENLRRLGFLKMTDQGHAPGTIRYGLSPKYKKYLSKKQTDQTE